MHVEGPICCKTYNVNGDPQLLIFLSVQKNIYSLSPLSTRSLTSAQAEIRFFKSWDRGCRTKGPLPNLGRLTVTNKRNTVQFSFARIRIRTKAALEGHSWRKCPSHCITRFQILEIFNLEVFCELPKPADSSSP